MKNGHLISIHSGDHTKLRQSYVNTPEEGDGFGLWVTWEGESGEELDTCPFSQDQTSDEEGTEGVDLNFEKKVLQGRSFAGQQLDGAIFRSSDLKQADFSNAILCLADFSQVDASGAAFLGADLTYANFEMSLLKNADFRHCDLAKANFSGAVLCGAIFFDADLELADLTEADLRGADLRGADLRFSKVVGAIVDDSTQLPFTLTQAAAMGMKLQLGRAEIAKGRLAKRSHHD